jgi:hypothetical protein
MERTCRSNCISAGRRRGSNPLSSTRGMPNKGLIRVSCVGAENRLGTRWVHTRSDSPCPFPPAQLPDRSVPRLASVSGTGVARSTTADRVVNLRVKGRNYVKGPAELNENRPGAGVQSGGRDNPPRLRLGKSRLRRHEATDRQSPARSRDSGINGP